MTRSKSMLGQIHNNLCLFSNLDSVTRNRMFMSYCSSFYVCELWDLYNKEAAVFCTTWRKGARRIWTLLRNAHCNLLYATANYMPICDELFCCMYNFLFSCLNSDSRFIRFIVLRVLRMLARSLRLLAMLFSVRYICT
jgi:hypothetical protein